VKQLEQSRKDVGRSGGNNEVVQQQAATMKSLKSDSGMARLNASAMKFHEYENGSIYSSADVAVAAIDAAAAVVTCIECSFSGMGEKSKHFSIKYQLPSFRTMQCRVLCLLPPSALSRESIICIEIEIHRRRSSDGLASTAGRLWFVLLSRPNAIFLPYRLKDELVPSLPQRI